LCHIIQLISVYAMRRPRPVLDDKPRTSPELGQGKAEPQGRAKAKPDLSRPSQGHQICPRGSSRPRPGLETTSLLFLSNSGTVKDDAFELFLEMIVLQSAGKLFRYLYIL